MSFLRNLRYSLRLLLKQPSFSLTVILSLALGIGGTVAVFSLTDAVLLRPLQFGNESRVVQVSEVRPSFSTTEDPVAPPNFADWKSRNHVFTDIGAAAGSIFAITGNGRPEQVDGTLITANLLPVLGVKPLIGRNFRAEEDQPGSRRVALISASLWQTRYGANPNVTNETIRLDGIPYSIVGVMPFGFTFRESSEVWVPLALTPAQLRDRDSHYLLVYGLLRPGVTLDAARRDLQVISKRLQQEYPANIGVLSSLLPLREKLVGKVRPAILVLAVGVLTILLTTCANIAGLMIARSTTRERELAIKTALGASAKALFYEHLLESVLLSLAGAAAGVLLATFLVPRLHTLVPLSLAAWAHPQINAHALLFALLTCLVAAMGFSLASHRFLAAAHSSAVLRYGRATVSSDKRLIRSILVGAQIALATVILIATGLLGETFYKLAHSDLGFNPEHVLTLRTELPSSDASPYRSFEARTSFYKRVIEKVEQLPGVVAAGYTTFLPLTNGGGQTGILQEGAPPLRPGQWNDVNLRIVTPGYFRAIGNRLVAGRFLTPHDNNPQAPSAVISGSTARKYWPGVNPIGRRFRLDTDNKAPLITIAGVIADVRNVNIQAQSSPEIYLSYLEQLNPGYFRPRDLAIRVSGDPATYVASVRQAIWSVDSEEPIASVSALQGLIDDRLGAYQLEANLFGWFALASLLLSSIGLYGLLSYDVAQRTREIGLRMALGAERRNVVNRFVGAALKLCLAGIVAGGLLSFALVNVLRTLLYGVAGWDAPSRAAAALVVLSVALLAAYLPARRASRIDPMEALRAE